MLGTSAAVQAAVAGTGGLTTAVAAAPGSAMVGGESAADSGEFTLDAATLEQLRGAGDSSSLIDSSTAGFSEATTDDQSTMQVDGCVDVVDWTQGLVQLDGPMDSEDIADEDDGEVEGLDPEDQDDGGEAADGGFDHSSGLDSAADGGAEMMGDGVFVSEADELSAVAASAGLTAAELSAHSSALDADDPAAAYMMQVTHRHTTYLYCHTAYLDVCCAVEIQESLANTKQSARQQCVCEGP